MDKFAKLFERDGRQVLVTRGITDDLEHTLTIEARTLNSGHSLQINTVFVETDEGRKARDLAFEKCGEAQAFWAVETAPGYDL